MTRDTNDFGDFPMDEAKKSARGHGVSPDIHAADLIFRFLVQTASDQGKAVRDYFDGGAGAAAWLKRTVSAYRKVDEPFSLLEFAAGYGRVTRHLPKALPAARIVASDIHPSAVEFLRGLGAVPLQSTFVPETFGASEQFDVILALSFFTHMPKESWTRWMRALVRHLKPNGVLIFTTHGVPGMKVMGEALARQLPWDADGFWFEPVSEQDDIDTEHYGSTGTSFSFVHEQIETSGARLAQYQERGAGYQDVYVVRKPEALDPALRPSTRGPGRKSPRRAAPRIVEDAKECIFYHTMEVPGLGLVQGQWDLRGSEQDILGGITLGGRSVLEVGPASGYLTYWMEEQGARVTAFDLDESESWDLVPFAGKDRLGLDMERRDLIRRINNAWWLIHNARKSTAQCAYGTVYDLDETLGDFDVVTINSVLLQLRDPFKTMELAAARAKHQIVITEVSEVQFQRQDGASRDPLAMSFIPRFALQGPIDGWWYLPSGLIAEFLRILGFRTIEQRNFQAKFQDGHLWDLFTVVGTR